MAEIIKEVECDISEVVICPFDGINPHIPAAEIEKMTQNFIQQLKIKMKKDEKDGQ